MTRLSSYRDFDWVLLGFVGLLSIISVLEIKSATLHTKFHGFETKQILFLAAGLALMFIISLIDYHRLLDISPWAYGISIVALVAVKIVGTKVLGAKRWINLGGGVHFQPSEWVKLVLIISVARYFWPLVGHALSWKDIAKASLLVGIPMVLVLIQPDLGTTLTYLPILIVGLFLGGLTIRQASIIVLCLAMVGGIAWKSGKRLKPYQQARITAFLDPDSDPKGSGYQIRQSLIAVGSWRLGQRSQSGNPDPGRLPPHPLHRLHLRRLLRRTRLRRCCRRPPAILVDIDAFDTKRSNSPRPARNLHHNGRRGRHRLSDRGQRRDGLRVDACHRNPPSAHELRRIVDSLHLPRAWNCHEHPYAPVCELTFLHPMRTQSSTCSRFGAY